MPQNTPMKRQFTTIDGRTVMSNLPQHWGGNDWAITGVDNPLPVGNYVQTESGVWIPQKGSDDGAADVQLTGRKVQLASNDLIQNISASAGTFVYVAISPPAGELWRIKTLRILTPKPSSVGATSGTHAVHVIPMSTGSGYRVLYAQANYDIDISILSNIIVSATTKEPSTEIAQQNAILNIAVTNDRPLYIRYDNYTNVDLTDRSFTIVLSREVEYIA